MVGFPWELFSAKQLDFLENSDHRVNIATGAVSSGKTIIANLRFLIFVLESPYTEFMITSKTQQTLYRNVLKNFMKMLESMGYVKDKDFKHKKVDMVLEIYNGDVTKEIYLIGLTDEGSTERLQGLTVHGWYADEVVNAPASSVDMGYSRCRLPGAKMFFTCNPDSPYHNIFVEYIDDAEAISSGRVGVWSFVLDDNLTLEEDYKKDLIAKEKKKGGIFYKRNILGQWVSASGAIYQGFSEHKHVYDKEYKYSYFDNIRVGVDYGTASETVFLMIGLKYFDGTDNSEDYVEYRVLDEFVWNVKERGGVQLTDSGFVDKMKDFLIGVPYNVINVPHDARSFQNALEESGFRCQMINPDVNMGIKNIQDLFGSDHLFIHDKCNHLIRCIGSYVWDPKALKRGVEKPLKKNDHSADALRIGIGIENVFTPIVATAGYW